jgi:hypothetical protein
MPIKRASSGSMATLVKLTLIGAPFCNYSWGKGARK